MNGQTPRNALLLELMIVVFFFLLAASVLLQGFLGARRMTQAAGCTEAALGASRYALERAAASDDAAQALLDMGFERAAGAFVRDDAGVALRATVADEPFPAGALVTVRIEATASGETISTLSLSRYHPKGGAAP